MFEEVLAEVVLGKAFVENVVQQVLSAFLTKALEQQVEVETTRTLKTMLSNLDANVMVGVGLGIDVTYDVEVEEVTHEANQEEEEEKIKPKVDRHVESIAPDNDRGINAILLETVLEDVEQSVEILVRVVGLLNVALEVDGIVLEDGSKEEHVDETCFNKLSTGEGELVHKALVEKYPFDKVASKTNSARMLLEHVLEQRLKNNLWKFGLIVAS